MAAGADSELRGELSSWFGIADGAEPETRLGLRYIPECSGSQALSGGIGLDVRLALNAYWQGSGGTFEDAAGTADLDAYRAWVRVAGAQWELRGGLQKINFGTAALIRPLMWFDRIDPRDPLAVTDGVYGLLGRRYFLSNANLWVWALYGNDEAKGWESLPTAAGTLEAGGRVQVPVGPGEFALTYHHRRADPTQSTDSGLAAEGATDEHRYGADGKWDLGAAVWFEGMLVEQQFEDFPLRYRRMVALGADYTFGVGNGLHALCEHAVADRAEHALGSGEGTSFSAGSLDYPFGLLDRLTGMVYYDWEADEWYQFVDWQRTYDQWRLHFMAFVNPESGPLDQASGTGALAGRGVQVLVVLNH